MQKEDHGQRQYDRQIKRPIDSPEEPQRFEAEQQIQHFKENGCNHSVNRGSAQEAKVTR